MVDPITAWIWIQVIPIPALLDAIPDPRKSGIVTPLAATSASKASSSLSHHTWAVPGNGQIWPSPPGPQQPHSQQHQNSVSNREIEITFGFCSVHFLLINCSIAHF